MKRLLAPFCGLLSCSMLLGIMPLQVLADEIQDQMKCRSLEEYSYSVQENTISSWSGHSNMEIVFTNTGDETIHNWYYTFDYPYNIENPYNCGIIEHEGDLYTIANADWNQDIKPGESVTIGFTAASYDGSDIEVTPSFYLLNTKTIELNNGEISVQYAEYSDWTSGFSGAIILGNNTDEAIRDWSVTFSANRPITEAYSSIFTVNEDGTYTFENDGNNQNLSAYAIFQIGINGGEHDSSVAFEITDFSASAKCLGLSLTDDNNGNGIADVTETDYSGIVPTPVPTVVPTEEPTGVPTIEPTTEPTIIPTVEPTVEPTITEVPTVIPTVEPTTEPTATPTAEPTITEIPTVTPTAEPTSEPTITVIPTVTPTAVPTDYIEIDYYTDSDEDYLPDDLEDMYGTDKNNPDTDGDGIIDGYDVDLGLNPLSADSDGNGISDADEDLDNDGLSNIVEIELGSNPLMEDTDYDGLTDGDEVYIYSTSPSKYDTDDDGINDFNEIQMNLNPLVPDADEQIYQTLTYAVTDESSPAGIVSVTVDGYIDGCISENTTIQNLYGKDVLCSSINGLVGVPVEIESTGDFDYVTITFAYDDTVSEEDLRIVWYDEANNEFVFLDNCYVDTDSNTVSVTTTHFSKYMLVDYVAYVKQWGRACNLCGKNYLSKYYGNYDVSEWLSQAVNEWGDSDGDGLPNVLETGGMLNCAGKVVYSDPNKKDTDGDGINDLDEMGELKSLDALIPFDDFLTYMSLLPVEYDRAYFRYGYFSNGLAVSDGDIDGDGIDDNEDANPNYANGKLNVVLYNSALNGDSFLFEKTANEYENYLKNNSQLEVGKLPLPDTKEKFAEQLYSLVYNWSTGKQKYTGIENLIIITHGSVGYFKLSAEKDSVQNHVSFNEAFTYFGALNYKIDNVDLQVCYQACKNDDIFVTKSVAESILASKNVGAVYAADTQSHFNVWNKKSEAYLGGGLLEPKVLGDIYKFYYDENNEVCKVSGGWSVPIMARW